MENPNPISELISDDIFELLNSRGLINEMSVRDYQIKKKFKHLREKKIRAGWREGRAGKPSDLQRAAEDFLQESPGEALRFRRSTSGVGLLGPTKKPSPLGTTPLSSRPSWRRGG